jgi:hypothetical protein
VASSASALHVRVPQHVPSDGRDEAVGALGLDPIERAVDAEKSSLGEVVCQVFINAASVVADQRRQERRK